MRRTGWVCIVLAAMLVTSIAPAVWAQGASSDSPTLVGAIHIGPLADGGWTWQHDRSLRQALSKFGTVYDRDGKAITADGLGSVHYTVKSENKTVIEVSTIESVGPQDFLKDAQTLLQGGAKLILATAEDYRNDVNDLADQNPNANFAVIHADYEVTRTNVASYFGRSYIPMYEMGVIAKEVSGATDACFIGAYPENGQVNTNLAGFALGFGGKTHAVFTNTWYDPVQERSAAENCDAKVYAAHQDSTAVGQLALERGAYAFGYDSDWREKLKSDRILASTVYDWSQLYVDFIQGTMDNKFPAGRHWLGAPMVTLSPLSPLVPEAVQQHIATIEQDITSGKLKVFPTLSDEQIWGLTNWKDVVPPASYTYN
jgi:basic membrane protein A and related proteins